MKPVEAGVFALELARAACVLPFVEAASRFVGPRPIVDVLRTIGAFAPRRDPAARARLRRAIGAIDSRVWKKSGCYRRSLVEMALDRGAAAETLHIGLHADGSEGHAWLDSETRKENFDLEITI